MRLRDLGLTIGRLPTGKYNAITDVRGVRVGHVTLNYDKPRIARTGVTVIVPTETPIWDVNLFAGFHVLNGNGDFTGTHWVEESGLLTTPIALTNTHQVGVVRDALVKIEFEHRNPIYFAMPLVAETMDGWLNDINAHHVTEAHVREAFAAAKSGPVAEGCVGAGTGIIAFNFKSGIGTASRVVSAGGVLYTVGALVQSNFGSREYLRVDGVPVGQAITSAITPLARPAPWQIEGSVVVVLATNAPLIPDQCRRLAQRATIGLARTGCIGHNSSGDLFLAFSTGNGIIDLSRVPFAVEMLPQWEMNPLFDAAAEAVEEAVINALVAAETTTGFQGRVAQAIPLDTLKEIMSQNR